MYLIGVSFNLRVVHFKDSGNFSNDWIFGKFSKPLGNPEISKISRYLRNFQYSKINYPQILLGTW